jgi:hypothetical protein
MSTHRNLKHSLGGLQSSGVAVLLSIMVLVSVAMVLPEVWLLMFSIAISFVLSDIILNLILHVVRRGIGEDFWRISKPYSNGQAYTVFLFGVFLATAVGAALSNWMLHYTERFILLLFPSSNQMLVLVLGRMLTENWFIRALLFSCIIALAAFADLHWRFRLTDKT